MRLAGHLCGSRCQDVIEGFNTHSHILFLHSLTVTFFLQAIIHLLDHYMRKVLVEYKSMPRKQIM